MANLLKVDYLAKERELFLEIFKLKKYRSMSKFLAATLIFIFLPLVFVTLILAVIIAILSLILKAVDDFASYLRNIEENSNQNGKKVIFIIRWILIIALYAFAFPFFLLIVITYPCFQAISYIWTLGGFKFNLYIKNDTSFALDQIGRYKKLCTALYFFDFIVNIILFPLLIFIVCLVVISALFIYSEPPRDFLDVLENVIWPTFASSVAGTAAIGLIVYIIQLVKSTFYSFFILSRPFSLTSEIAPNNSKENNDETKKIVE